MVTRPTSAVKPTNVTSKVDSGLSRAGPGRTPVVRRPASPGNRPGVRRSQSPGNRPGHQRSQSAGPSRKNSLQNRQVANLKPSHSATPELTRKRANVTQLSLADDEASDTENESRYGSLFNNIFNKIIFQHEIPGNRAKSPHTKVQSRFRIVGQ